MRAVQPIVSGIVARAIHSPLATITTAMIDCDELIDRLHADAKNHVHLATIAKATTVAEMHVDLAIFSEAQAQMAEELCEDG